MVFGFVLLSTGNPHLYKGKECFLSWVVSLRFLEKSFFVSKIDQPTAAEQRGNLSSPRGETLKHKSEFCHCPDFKEESRTSGKANEVK